MIKKLLIFLILFLPLLSNAASVTVDVDNIRYTVDDVAKTAEVYGRVPSTTITNLVIPDNIQYNNNSIPVTSIRNFAFYSIKDLRGSLTIGNNVQTIGAEAFSECTGFTGSLTIGDNVQTIENNAFFNCTGFTGSLTIPNSVQTIGNNAFGLCTGFSGSLTIGDNVQTIGRNAFGQCTGFTGSLTIGDKVQTIGQDAFYDCKGFTGSLTIPNSVQTIGNSAFAQCTGFTGSLTIGDNVQTIENNAFLYCRGFTGSLTIPNSVQTIGNNAFNSCYGFTGSLTIPNSVQTIGYGAFQSCINFTGSLTIGENVQTIGNNAFVSCRGFTGELVIPESVKEIEAACFKDCDKLTSLVITSSNTVIYQRAFDCSGLKSITCLGSTPPICVYGEIDSSYYDYVFNNYSYDRPLYVPAESVDLYKNATEWNKFTYINPIPIEAIDISLNKTELSLFIGQQETLIATLTPEDATTEVVWSTEENNIISVDHTGKVTALAVGVATVKASAGEISATCQVTVQMPETAEIELDDIIYIVETNKGTAYCKGPRVQSLVKMGVILKDEVEFANQTFPVVSIANSAFEGCTGLSGRISLGDNMTAIGEYAFKGCVNIQELYFPKSLTDIGHNAFEDCSELKLVRAYYTEWFYINFQNYYSNPLSQGADLSFLDSTAIGSFLVVPIWVNEVKPYAFWGWSKFQGTVEFPGTVKIGRAAFVDCSGIKNVKFTNSLEIIEYGAFSQCSGLTGELKIPDSVTTIENVAFAGCTNLTSIVLGSSLTSLGDKNFMGSTFGECPNIERVVSKSIIPPVCYGPNQFYNEVYQTATLYVPFGSVEAYKEANDWKQFRYITFIPEEATAIKLDREEAELHIEEKLKLNATIEPVSAMDTPITWSSSDTSIAVVNEMGEVNALALGTATITVSTSNNLSASCEVTVIPILANSISIDGSDIHILKQTETLQLTATIIPDNTTCQEIIWKSSDESKATVSTSGLVTAVEEGDVEITATLSYQPQITASYNLTIQKRLLGDANDNGVVNVADVGTISDYIVKKPVYNFCFVNADVITDGEITTADVTATVDIIFNDTPSIAKFAKVRKISVDGNNELIVDNFNSPASSIVGINLKNPSEFTGLQGAILIPEDVTVSNVTKGSGASNHILNYNVTDYGTIEFILYSLQNATFDRMGSLIELEIQAQRDCDDIIVENILASDSEANEYSLPFTGGKNYDLITSLDNVNNANIQIYSSSQGVVILNAHGENVNIFNIAGERIISERVKSNKEFYPLTSGIYIVTVKTETSKLIVK